MSEKGFEFAWLIGAPEEREFFPRSGMEEGTGIKLMLNLDYLTLEHMDELDVKFNSMFDGTVSMFREVAEAMVDEPEPEPEPGRKPRSKKALAVAGRKPEKFTPPPIELFAFDKAKARFYIEVLAGEVGNADPTKRLIYGWDVVANGKPVPVSNEAFQRIPLNLLGLIWKFVLGEANNPTPSEKKESAST